MGQFRLEITAVGGHGCQREVRDGGTVHGCGRQGCPDCEFASMICEFARRTGCSIQAAQQVHWPGTSNEVIDEVTVTLSYPITAAQRLARVRHGSFS